MSKIIKFTARYNPIEDRIRFDCMLEKGAIVGLLFTQKFCNQAVSLLTSNLESLERTEIQEFKQDAAATAYVPSRELERCTTINSTFLVTRLKLYEAQSKSRIEFYAQSGTMYFFPVGEVALRKVLLIFWKTYRLALWDTKAFPAWISPKHSYNAQAH